MKYVIRIFIAFIIIIGAGIFYLSKYTYYDLVEDKWVLLNPFQPTIEDYNFCVLNASIYLKRKDSVNAKYFYKKALEFRNSHNERQYEEIFSCGNGYWEYKQKQILHYSLAYEMTGQMDSAISCLKRGVYNVEKYHFDTDMRFFYLQVKKLGKQKVIEGISKGLDKIEKENADCFMCSDYFFSFQDFKIGIDQSQYELSVLDKNELLKELLVEYNIKK